MSSITAPLHKNFTSNRSQVWRLVSLAVLTVAYLFSRLVFLLRLPAFIDEAINIELARQSLEGDRRAGLEAGRWLTVKIQAALLTLPGHPLLMARLLSVVAGLVTLLLCVAIGRLLFSERDGLLAGALLVVSPFALFLDRMALADSSLTAWGAGILLVSILMTRSTKRIYPVSLALLLASGTLVKTTGILFASIPALAMLLLLPRSQWLAALRRFVPPVLSGLLLFVLVIRYQGLVISQTAVSNGQAQLLGTIANNLALALSWLWTWVTPPIAILALLSPLLLLRGEGRGMLFLLAVPAILLAIYVLISKTWFPRYLLFTVIPISLLAARVLGAIWSAVVSHLSPVTPTHGILGIALLLCMLLWPLRADALLVSDPPNAPMPPLDHWQYIVGWPAGYGLPELAKFLQDAATQPGGVNVLSFPAWRPSYSGLNVYVSPSESLRLDPIHYTDSPSRAWASDLARQSRTLVVLEAESITKYGQTMDKYFLRGDKVWSYVKKGGTDGLEVWEVLP